ncbi:nucleoplasmin-2a isoform X1 [Megalobrama amblycephala]|uniref:nucleoplasmin-2a isoform X1 n=1 Tax=Megalobrama amblycephala TaxID=75352 RepID=UPI002013E54C|nr:nucleoplasmin-2a isoform X1 [Megalobrama amblycephala]XP_048065188.1 nucleoplasmin-2a isoform X1 [Megalobrama amblycephala]XP_048065189.1 nucleoplasmin-2a isoform X1 [Megalobrama amblycephala]
MLVEMTNCFVENDSLASISLSEISSSSSVSDRACVHWGCVLSDSKTTAVFQAENDLLENQFFIKTINKGLTVWNGMRICLSEEAGDEMHIVAVCDSVGASKPLPIATLRHCMPMISFPSLELIPPVTFKLCSGKGPVFISAQHITLNPIEMTEGEEDDEEEDEDG